MASGEGVPPSTAAAVTEAIVAEVRKQSRADVMRQREIASILSLEKQKATAACMAELGGTLGTDRLALDAALPPRERVAAIGPWP